MEKKILILGNPQSHPSSEAFLHKFIRIMNDLNDEVYVISGDKPPLYDNVIWKKPTVQINTSLIKRFIFFLRLQVQIVMLIWNIKDKFHSVIILPTSYFFPLIILKIMGKKIGLFVAQKPSLTLIIFSKINFIFSNVLIIESKSVISDWGITKYKNKICIGGLYVDSIFSMEKSIFERKKIVGFIGRLSEEKGVLNFLESIPDVLKYDENLKFLIAGNGELSNEIKKTLKEKHLIKSVRLVDWIPHNNLPNHLNGLELMILPSLTEGLPNIILESMACGTPVLANSVGGIPSLIKNGKTGFLMEDNTSKSITKNLIKVLKDEKTIEVITKNAQKLIEDEYRYQSSLERYKKILKYLGN